MAGDSRQVRVVFAGQFKDHYKPHLTEVVRRLGGQVIESDNVYTSEATHCVIDTFRECPPLGLLVVGFVLAGKPVLTADYVIASRKEKRFLDPTRYREFTPTYLRSAVEFVRERGGRLFSGQRVSVMLNDEDKRAEIQTILRDAGARIVELIPRLLNSLDTSRLIQVTMILTEPIEHWRPADQVDIRAFLSKRERGNWKIGFLSYYYLQGIVIDPRGNALEKFDLSCANSAASSFHRKRTAPSVERPPNKRFRSGAKATQTTQEAQDVITISDDEGEAARRQDARVNPITISDDDEDVVEEEARREDARADPRPCANRILRMSKQPVVVDLAENEEEEEGDDQNEIAIIRQQIRDGEIECVSVSDSDSNEVTIGASKDEGAPMPEVIEVRKKRSDANIPRSQNEKVCGMDVDMEITPQDEVGVTAHPSPKLNDSVEASFEAEVEEVEVVQEAEEVEVLEDLEEVEVMEATSEPLASNEKRAQMPNGIEAVKKSSSDIVAVGDSNIPRLQREEVRGVDAEMEIPPEVAGDTQPKLNSSVTASDEVELEMAGSEDACEYQYRPPHTTKPVKVEVQMELSANENACKHRNMPILITEPAGVEMAANKDTCQHRNMPILITEPAEVEMAANKVPREHRNMPILITEPLEVEMSASEDACQPRNMSLPITKPVEVEVEAEMSANEDTCEHQNRPLPITKPNEPVKTHPQNRPPLITKPNEPVKTHPPVDILEDPRLVRELLNTMLLNQRDSNEGIEIDHAVQRTVRFDSDKTTTKATYLSEIATYAKFDVWDGSRAEGEERAMDETLALQELQSFVDSATYPQARTMHKIVNRYLLEASDLEVASCAHEVLNDILFLHLPTSKKMRTYYASFLCKNFAAGQSDDAELCREFFDFLRCQFMALLKAERGSLDAAKAEMLVNFITTVLQRDLEYWWKHGRGQVRSRERRPLVMYLFGNDNNIEGHMDNLLALFTPDALRRGGAAVGYLWRTVAMVAMLCAAYDSEHNVSVLSAGDSKKRKISRVLVLMLQPLKKSDVKLLRRQLTLIKPSWLALLVSAKLASSDHLSSAVMKEQSLQCLMASVQSEINNPLRSLVVDSFFATFGLHKVQQLLSNPDQKPDRFRPSSPAKEISGGGGDASDDFVHYDSRVGIDFKQVLENLAAFDKLQKKFGSTESDLCDKLVMLRFPN